MKTLFKSWVLMCFMTYIHTFSIIRSASSQCLPDQKSILLELRDSLDFIHKLSTKLVAWNDSNACCNWRGVQCNRSNSQVTGLDLSEEAITSGIDNRNSLFRLQHLKRLNLAYNPFSGKIPSALGNLSSLTYLNLSHTGFIGQVPVQISQLVNLVVLDLSMTRYDDVDPFAYSTLQVNLARFMHNLTQLKEVYLGGIVFSQDGNKWGEALSSLTNLQVLSMPYCDLRGGFHPSLANLRALSVIDFEYNELFSSPIPEFFATFTNLTILRCSNCSLTGTFPRDIFQVSTLTTLVLFYNPNLKGTLPSSIGKLTKLVELTLFECNFQGIIPPSLGNLGQLDYLDLSYNNFSGQIPRFLSANNVTYLMLGYNSLTGRIPEQMFSKDSKLRVLELLSNNLEGEIPDNIFNLRDLEVIMFSFNRLNGLIKLHQILTSLPNLDTLELSYNNLTIDTNDTGANSSFPLLNSLSLASCNLHILPEFLKDQPYLYELDLSNNRIQGKIPGWIWNDRLYVLNLSYNSFVDMEPFPSIFPSNFHVLDLRANNIQGKLPHFPLQTALEYLDLSNNSFIISISPDFGSSLSSAQFISLARNRIHGDIPTSLCNVTSLRVLDLSYNALNGSIPLCLTAITQNLAVLNLRRNFLHGPIPDTIGENCTLETLDLNMNHLDGRIPKSTANCQDLRVLDLGNNRLSGTFPCQLKNLSSLQVLILRSNQLHGTVICPDNKSFLQSLQIIDLASNHFTGHLSTLFHDRRMMVITNETKSNPSFLQYQTNNSAYTYYQDVVVVTFKSSEFEMQKILTIFTSIDLSNNAFYGELPRELGNLNALKVLNLSHNALSGNIPQSVGNLSQLESLDLSYNSLSGSIPQQLAKLSFIGYLNLSFNHLTGLIPTSTQLQTFDASTYNGNPGLFGPPLATGGKSDHGREMGSPTSRKSKIELEWMLSGAAVGYAVGIIMFYGPLLCIKRLREWYNYNVDRLLMKILPSEDSRRRKRSRKLRMKQRNRD